MSGKLITPNSNAVIALSEGPLVWEPRVIEWPNHPPQTRVRIIFNGLMGFCCRSYDFERYVCDVGFHKGNSRHPHRLKILAFDRSCDTPIQIPNSPSTNVSVEADATIESGVGFYQPTDVTSRDELDDRDFRWIIDFESDYLYGRHLPDGTKTLRKKANVYRPKLEIYNGLFYTLHKTASTFRAQTRDGDPRYIATLGNVADYIAADIYVPEGSAVRLTIDGNVYMIHPPGEIQFFNDCHDPDSDEPCDFNPYDLSDKKNRNDFYVNYGAFHLDGLREYELFLIEYHRPSRVPICGAVPLTDEAPCAGSGYGGGGGLP